MTTTIGENTRIDGRIEGDEDVVVHGRVDGTIVLSATLTVTDGGFVTGDVQAQTVVVEGAIAGTVRAEEVVHLADGAQAEAEIFANAIRLDSGAKLKGRVEMDVEAAPPMPTRPEPGTSTDAERRTTPKKRSKPEAAAKPEPATKRAPSSTNGVDIDPDELTVKELRELLQDRDLPVSGTKAELVERLRQGG